MNKGKKFLKGLLITLAVLVIVAAIGVLLWYVAKQNDKLPTIFTGGQAVQTSAKAEMETASEVEESVESEETRQENETAQETQTVEVQETVETTPEETVETSLIETEEAAETVTMETRISGNEILTVSGNEALTVSGNESTALHTEENSTEETGGETQGQPAEGSETEEASAQGSSLWVSTAGGTTTKTNEITGYEVEMDDFGLAEDQGPAITAEFARLTFTGTNTDRTNWLNNQIQKLEDAYQKQVEDANLSAKQQELAEAGFSGILTYSPKTAESVYYEGGVVSIAYQSVWYEDGIKHQSWDTLNVDTSIRKSIPLQDVLGMSLEETQETIIQALQSQYGVSRNRIKDIIQDKTEFSYYYDKDSLVVCFDSYELGLPNAEQQIILDRPLSDN